MNVLLLYGTLVSDSRERYLSLECDAVRAESVLLRQPSFKSLQVKPACI